MKPNKSQSLIFTLVGIIIIGAGLYIYFVAHSIYPHTESSRLKDFNALLKTLGKTGTSILCIAIGAFFFYFGIKGFFKRK